MVYIIGIDHLVQYDGPLPGPIREEFKAYLVGKVRELDIGVIAEEFNEEFLHDVCGSSEDTALAAAELTGITHIYCDPDARERRELGIPYHADVEDAVRRRYGATEAVIFDNELRRKVADETAAGEKRFWPVRESFWLERIRGFCSGNVLFLCGHEHASRFHDLLEREGFASAVVDEFWRRSLFSDYRNIGLE